MRRNTKNQPGDIELKEYNKANKPVYQDEETRRTSSALAANFQAIRQKTQNHVAADKSRKTSRLTKNLDPNVPAPKKHYEGKF
jgi:hypothetical protein